MRHLFGSLAVGCALLAAGVVQASEFNIDMARDGKTGVVSGVVHFGIPAIEPVRGGVSIDVDGLGHTIQAGMPSVPVKTYKLALPQGAVVTGVHIENSVRHMMRAEVVNNDSQLPYSWNAALSAAAPTASAPVVPTVWPASETVVSTQRLHGVDIAIVTVYPVRVVDGWVDALQDGRVVVWFEGGTLVSPPLFPHQMDAVRAFVDNPDALEWTVRASDRDSYDYLIVTPSMFASAMGQYSMSVFQKNLSDRGMVSRIVTVEEITQSGTGADLAAKIRNRIREEYLKSGIKYVLLAGDGDASGTGAMIPARKLWGKVYAYDGSWKWVEEQIPADLYYSNLDGDFNGNGNGNWGEPTDGVNGGDVDLLAEVALGRMPMKTTAELANFVRKTIQVASTSAVKNTFLMGEVLFAEKGWYGGDYMDQLAGQCTDHNYETNGYGSDWNIQRLYDSKSGSNWSGSQALAAINKGGFAMINHLGHSNQTSNMRMSSSWSFPAFTNPVPFFFYTQGCFPGDFTYNDSFIEKLVRHQYGAVAAIANTNYGLGPEDPAPETTKTPGASQMLHRRFVNAIISEGVTALGRANQVSKEEYIGLAGSNEIRWVMWDANYFGDPSLKIQ